MCFFVFLSSDALNWSRFLFLSFSQQWKPSRPPLTSRRRRTFGNCRSSTIRTCFLRCPASWSQKTCEGTKRTYKPYLQNLLLPPINPHTRPFILHCRRSTQLGCQSSQAPPPNHRTRKFVHGNGVNCALSDSVSMLIMTTRSGPDSFQPFFSFLAVHNWRETCPKCTAISWTEKTGISLTCTTHHPGLQKHRLHFGHSWP